MADLTADADERRPRAEPVQRLAELEADDAELIGVYTFAPLNQVIIAYHLEARGEVTLSPELAEFKRVPIAKLRPWPIGPGPAVADWLAKRKDQGKDQG